MLRRHRGTTGASWGWRLQQVQLQHSWRPPAADEPGAQLQGAQGESAGYPVLPALLQMPQASFTARSSNIQLGLGVLHPQA